MYDVTPDGYIPGIDTAGSLGGVVVSMWTVTDPAVLRSAASSKPQDDAILQIVLAAGRPLDRQQLQRGDHDLAAAAVRVPAAAAAAASRRPRCRSSPPLAAAVRATAGA